MVVSGALGLAAVLVSASLFAVNRAAPGLSPGFMKIHCLSGLAAVLFALIHAWFTLPAAWNWSELMNLGLVLVIAGSGMLLRHVPEAGALRHQSASLHPALVLALLVSLVFHIL